MKIERQGETLIVGEISELSAATAHAFCVQMSAAVARHSPMQGGLKAIEIDLAATTFVDSCGLSALITIHKAATREFGGAAIRLLNPTPSVHFLIQMTQMHRLFEIVKW